MTVADPIRLGLLDAYRSALAEGIPQAEADVFEHALAGACVARAADRLTRFQVLDQRDPGHESRAQMVSTLDAAVRSVRALGSVRHLADWAESVSQFLRSRWPDADRRFPDAYTTREG
jgi:hypothetical protein